MSKITVKAVPSNTNVSVQDGNTIITNVQGGNDIKVVVTPTPKQVIQVDRTVTGNGIPAGGTTGQVLAKSSNTNYDVEWETLANVARTGSYNDLIDTPDFGTGAFLDAGVANGLATLDENGYVPIDQLPPLGNLNYQGTWNANTNTPTLASSIGVKGYYYVVNIAGNTNLNGITDWQIGDWAVFNGTIWQKVDNTDTVTSVNGYTGTVVLTQSDIAGTADAPVNTNITSMTGVTGGISSPDFVQLDTTADASIGLGKLRWNATTTTASFGIIDGTVECNIGEQVYAYVTNADSVTILKGQPVYLYAATGNRASVKLASNLGDATSAKTLGLATQNILPNQVGFITTQGVLDKIDTSAFAEGDTLYLGSSAGTLTNVKPKAPNHLVYIGVVERANNGNGQIYVRPQNGYELDEIHDVQINNPVSGNVLIYDAVTKLWKNALLTPSTGISVTNGNGSITLTNTAPDQIVSLNAGANITITGTYPNFTISATDTTGVTSVTASSPLSSSGGTSPNLSISQANSTTNGFLSSSDWNTFNNKGNGTVTSVNGTGTVSGLTLSGTVTSSGSLTLGGSLDLSSPPSIGSTTPSTGAFTTLNSTGSTELGGTVGNSTVRIGAFNSAYFDFASGVNFVSLSTRNLNPTSDFVINSQPSSGTATITLRTNNVSQFRVTNTNSAVNLIQVTGSATNNATIIQTQGSDTNVPLNIVAKGTGSITLQGGGGAYNIFEFNQQASTVNRFRSTATATGVSPLLSAVGNDANIPIRMRTQGTGAFQFETGSSGNEQFRINNATSAVNYVQVSGNSANNSPEISVAGSDTNIPLTLESKGTGAINIAGGSRGVNISNGMTVTAITRTANGSGYTTNPTVAISPPTTTGGVQATANATMFAIAATVQSGGTGYTVNDVLTVVGGTYSSQATFTVSSVSGGVVTAVTLSSGGTSYSVLPTNPVSVTGGTGSGCTLNITSWGVSTLTITNAGSGYVEQPTVTFSGGGGSGAAAYARIGGDSTLKALGTNLNISTSNTNIGFQVFDSGQNGTNYWAAGAGYSTPYLLARGSTNTQGNISSSGTSSLVFQTNGGGQTQFIVSHTASAVNYVQVTGGATGSTNFPRITAEGSDSAVWLNLSAKGASGIRLFTDSMVNEQLRITRTASAVNFMTITGAASGATPTMSVGGTDTNIDLALTPKGTGLVRFGTYTAGALSIAGYIEIKDAGGTIRRLAVVA